MKIVGLANGVGSSNKNKISNYKSATRVLIIRAYKTPEVPETKCILTPSSSHIFLGYLLIPISESLLSAIGLPTEQSQVTNKQSDDWIDQHLVTFASVSSWATTLRLDETNVLVPVSRLLYRDTLNPGALIDDFDQTRSPVFLPYFIRNLWFVSSFLGKILMPVIYQVLDVSHIASAIALGCMHWACTWISAVPEEFAPE